MGLDREGVAGLVEKRLSLLARDRREAIQEPVERIARLKVVDQDLYRHSGTSEHKGRTYDVWRLRDDLCSGHVHTLQSIHRQT